MAKLKNKYYSTFKKREEFLQALHKTRDFKNRNICILGSGIMGRIILYWINYIFYNVNITIIDKNKEKLEFVKTHFHNVKIINKEITKTNYKNILGFLKKGDLLIDASYNIETQCIFKLCNHFGIIYINSAVECWNFKNITSPIEYSLFFRIKELKKEIDKEKHINTNFLVVMGCNPGNVNMWAKYGIYLLSKLKKIKFEENMDEKELYPFLAKKLGIEVIHISEYDSQIIDVPRKKGEYCNTWSQDPDSFYQEGLAPIELSWGTHEKVVPKTLLCKIDNNNERVVILKDLAINTLLRSYTPISKMYYGMAIRHDENLSIGNYLSISNGAKKIYQPSVYYVYKPVNALVESIQEMREDNFEGFDETKNRFLTTEIVEGRDELGLSFFLKNGEVYWIGSLLDIDESRKLHPKWMEKYVNATNLQVLGGYITGIMYLLDLYDNNINLGLLYPEDIPLEYLIYSLAFQGEFVFEKADWNNNKHPHNFGEKLKQKSWNFYDFFP